MDSMCRSLKLNKATIKSEIVSTPQLPVWQESLGTAGLYGFRVIVQSEEKKALHKQMRKEVKNTLHKQKSCDSVRGLGEKSSIQLCLI